jgi:hypothetical protein
MTSNYETLYGVGFLDDLHNYFPALLYDSSAFGSVRDVLGYIQAQARNRFDLFSYGQREYLSTHPPAQTVSQPNSYRHVVRTSFAGMPAPMPVPLSTLLRPTNATIASSRFPNPNTILPQSPPSTVQATVPSIQVNLNQTEEEEEEEVEIQENEGRFITNALLSLLNLPPTSLTRTYDIDAFGALLNGRPRTMDQFLQPVVVRPTPEQIDQNTTLGNLVSDTEHACAICQDALTSEQEGRKLNACGHWFHKSCIDTWLNGNVHCPVCRHDIREPMRQTSPAPEEST